MITAAEKLACAERELRLRQQVYPGRVYRGRMTRCKAAHEIAVMEAIVEDYRAAVEKEKLRDARDGYQPAAVG